MGWTFDPISTSDHAAMAFSVVGSGRPIRVCSICERSRIGRNKFACSSQPRVALSRKGGRDPRKAVSTDM